MIEEMSQSANSSEISSNDAIAKVLGKDYPGRVHCLDLGGLHSIAFSSTTRFSGMGCNFSSFDSAENSQLKDEVVSLKSKLAASQEDVKTLKSIMLTYIKMREGHVLAKLGALFSTDPTNIVDEGSEQDMSTPRGRSSLASNPR